MPDPKPEPAPRYILPLAILIVILGVLTPLAMRQFKNRQLSANEAAAVEWLRALARAQQAHFAAEKEYAQSFEELGGNWAGIQDLGAKTPSDIHGYGYRILQGQSASAEGGAKWYVDGEGRMGGGFALLAAPTRYGYTGRYTFLLLGSSIHYADLGPHTDQKARKIVEFYVPPESRSVPVEP